MKNLKRMIVLVALLFAISITAAGCGDNTPVQLATPTAQIVVNYGRLTVTTTDNPNAESYIFGVFTGPNYNDISLYYKVPSSTHFLDLTSRVTESAVYYFYVQVIGNGTKYLDSAISSVVSYDKSQALASHILSLTGTQLSWTGVTNNSGYKIFKNNVYLTTVTETTYDISSQINSPIIYNFEVQAIGSSSGGLTYSDSLKSNKVSYMEHLQLDIPTNLQVLQDEVTGEDYLTWDEVTNAVGYTIMVDSTTEVTAQTNLYDLSELDLAKQYAVQVKANASGVLIESNYSSAYYYDNYLILATPVIEGASRNGDDVMVVWQAVEHAESYTLLVNGETLKDGSDNVVVIYNTQVLVDSDLEKVEGGFDFEVYANAYSYYLQSETSSLFEYGGVDYLDAPVNITVNFDQGLNTVTVSWDEVAGADSYVVAINQEEYVAPSSSLEIESYIDAEEIVSIRVKAVGTGYVVGSEYGESVLFNYTTTSQAGYTDTYFYYYGYYDYYITSQEELNALFGYAISYQIEDFAGYINYTLSASEQEEADNLGNNDGIMTSTEEIRYKQHMALAAYTETHTLSYVPPEQGYAGKDYRFSLTYPYGMDPSLTSNDPEIYTQSEDFTPYKSATGRAFDYDNFVSENSLIEVPVYNSENLFMAVNSGAKPVFMVENSQAEAVYNAAKVVLRTIIDDSMTDYQKMLAIFDYVNYNTIYDRYVYNLALGGGSQNLPEYRVFYLEGVLLDGTAVCDGIAKTVALLASMEGIDAIKINGTAGSLTSSVGHAWNKVYLEVNGVSDWYIIDATWGITGYPESYIDADNSGTWDEAESYTDTNSNGIWDPMEDYVDENDNGSYDLGEDFNDVNLNGIWDDAEPFVDANGNGVWDNTEEYTDSYENGRYDYGFEYLTRDYFLMQDSDVEDTHFASSPINPVADTDFNYYAYTEFAPGYNYYIENQTQLNYLVQYLLFNDIEGVEVTFAPGFGYTYLRMQQAVNSSGVSNVDFSTFSYTSPISGNAVYMVDFIYS